MHSDRYEHTHSAILSVNGIKSGSAKKMSEATGEGSKLHTVSDLFRVVHLRKLPSHGGEMLSRNRVWEEVTRLHLDDHMDAS